MAKKILVAYFSASGITKGRAQQVAALAGGDLFEIVPKQPYTAADLDYMDEGSRTTLEMKDPAARPEIATTVPNMADYDAVLVGFPIWWYREPRIIDTFMESYDFSGKTVSCFATSGSSDMGNSAENLQELAPKANVQPGKQLNHADDADIKKWLDDVL